MNFVIDGNALLNVITSALIYNASQEIGDIYELDENDNKVISDTIKVKFDSFVKNFTKNIIYPFKNHIDRLFLTYDMPNWRKLYVNWYFEKTENSDQQPFVYKEKKHNDKQKLHRQQVRDLITYFHEKILDDFIELPGVETLQVHGAEADDIIMYLCNKLKDENIVIWTVDTDLTQLIERGERSVFILTPKQQKSRKKVYVTNEFFNPKTKEQDYLLFEFDKFDPVDIIDYLRESKEYQIIEIDPIRDIIIKVISGDKKSDNIPSIYTWENNGRNMSLTPKKAGEIIDELMSEHNWNIHDILDKLDSRDVFLIVNIINKVFEKYKALNAEDTDKRVEITKNLKLNIKLIRLTMDNVPGPILDRIDTQYIEIDNDVTFNPKMYLEKMDV